MKLSELLNALVQIQAACDDPEVEFKADSMTFQATSINASGTCDMPSILQGELEAIPVWDETVTINLEEI